MRPEPAQLCKKHVCLRQDQTRLRRNRVASSRNLPQGGSNPSRPRQVLPRRRGLLTMSRFDETILAAGMEQICMQMHDGRESGR
jgi:hypothetical protein